jgi:hypothetical protein
MGSSRDATSATKPSFLDSTSTLHTEAEDDAAVARCPGLWGCADAAVPVTSSWLTVQKDARYRIAARVPTGDSSSPPCIQTHNQTDRDIPNNRKRIKYKIILTNANSQLYESPKITYRFMQHATQMLCYPQRSRRVHKIIRGSFRQASGRDR